MDDVNDDTQVQHSATEWQLQRMVVSMQGRTPPTRAWTSRTNPTSSSLGRPAMTRRDVNDAASDRFGCASH